LAKVGLFKGVGDFEGGGVHRAGEGDGQVQQERLGLEAEVLFIEIVTQQGRVKIAQVAEANDQPAAGLAQVTGGEGGGSQAGWMDRAERAGQASWVQSPR
jgi:hypothetical protein